MRLRAAISGAHGVARPRVASKAARPGARRGYLGDRSPYSASPSLQNTVISQLEKLIRKQPQAQRTDKYTLMEIVDRLLEKQIGYPRPLKLRSHMVFDMFVKSAPRIRNGVKSACREWQGAFKGGVPVLTTTNAIEGKRLLVDARKYILQNPAKGKRRNFRTIPHNLCNNPACVNPQHIVTVLKNPLSHVGENHPRAKYSDQVIRKVVAEYNKGATAKQLAKKWGMSLTYVEQVMRKERREEATEGLKIRGRFGDY